MTPRDDSHRLRLISDAIQAIAATLGMLASSAVCGAEERRAAAIALDKADELEAYVHGYEIGRHG